MFWQAPKLRPLNSETYVIPLHLNPDEPLCASRSKKVDKDPMTPKVF